MCIRDSPCIDAARDAARGISDGKLAEKHAAQIDVRSPEVVQRETAFMMFQKSIC